MIGNKVVDRLLAAGLGGCFAALLGCGSQGDVDKSTEWIQEPGSVEKTGAAVVDGPSVVGLLLSGLLWTRPLIEVRSRPMIFAWIWTNPSWPSSRFSTRPMLLGLPIKVHRRM